MRSWSPGGAMLVLVGCGSGVGPAPAAPAAATSGAEEVAPPARDLAVPEPYRPPPQKPPEPGPGPGDPRRLPVPAGLAGRAPREQVLLDRRRLLFERAGANVAFAESELWEPCVRDFVRARPEPVRRALTAALARYQPACGPDGGVVLQGARGLDGRERRGRSDVGFTGTLTATRADVSLRVAYCGGPLAAERIVIAAGGERWTSPRLAFVEDEHGCEVAELPWTRSLARVVRAAADAADAVVSFEGRGAQDLALTDEMKQHLRAMLEALEALEAR